MRFPSDSLLSKSSSYSILFGALIVLVILAITSAIRETYRSWQVHQEIRGLTADIAALEGRRMRVETSLKNLQQPGVMDRKIRSHLGLQKPGERVYILGSPPDVSAPGSAGVAPLPTSLPIKWFRYFFHPLSL